MRLLHRVFSSLAFAVQVFWWGLSTLAPASPVLMISVDRLKPEYVFEADQSNL
ncbi:MAG: hypothetical protein ABSF94_00195 [Steroidobacteraceae bacterium]|jgi:hypothetical protein